jgi:hypothetical protein
MHEAAHGLAAAWGVRDTSWQGRYHNSRYRAWPRSSAWPSSTPGSGFGWAGTTVPDATAAVYAAEVEDLAAVLVAWRRPEGRAGSNNGMAARCGVRPPHPDRRVRARRGPVHLRARAAGDFQTTS